MKNETTHSTQDIRFSPAPHDPTRVLVTDDSKNAADILGVFLRIEGYEVSVAYDGQEALELSKAFKPKLAFLDLGMPGMDGLETAKLLREHDPEILLVALSGRGGEEDRRHTTDAGFDVHLVKPAKPDELKRALRLLQPQSMS